MANQWERFFPKPIGFEDWLQPPWRIRYAWAHLTEQDFLQQGSGAAGSAPCVACGGGWVVFQCGLKLSTGCAGSGASQEVKVKVTCQLCPGWERPNWEPMLAAANVGHGAS